jgi:hypothetical protein
LNSVKVTWRRTCKGTGIFLRMGRCALATRKKMWRGGRQGLLGGEAALTRTRRGHIDGLQEARSCVWLGKRKLSKLILLSRLFFEKECRMKCVSQLGHQLKIALICEHMLSYTYIYIDIYIYIYSSTQCYMTHEILTWARTLAVQVLLGRHV